MTDPLQLQLRDVHYPAHLSWWPPAPGWWIIMGIVFIITGIIWWWYNRRRKLMASAVRAARIEYIRMREQYESDSDALGLVRDLSILLRRLCVSIFPRTDSASLTGDRWLEFLDRPLPSSEFTSGPGRILVEAPYRPYVDAEEIEPLLELCDNWFDRLDDYRKARTP